MSNYKSEQRDGRTLEDWIRGMIFRAPCHRTCTFPGSIVPLVCDELAGHKGRHFDKLAEVSWGYSDNWETY